MHQTLPLDEMTVAEKLEAITAIWDSLLADDTNINSPDWHKTELDAAPRCSKLARQNF